LTRSIKRVDEKSVDLKRMLRVDPKVGARGMIVMDESPMAMCTRVILVTSALALRL